MKMSLCNACRFSVICCIIVLSNIDAPATAFTLRHTTKAIHADRNLAQEDSVILRVKRNSRIVSDHLNLSNNKTEGKKERKENGILLATKTIQPKQDFITEPNTTDQTSNIPNENLVTEQITVYEQKITTESSTLINPEAETFTSSFGLEDKSSVSMYSENTSERETTTDFIDLSTSELKLSESEQIELETTTIGQSKDRTVTDKPQFTKPSKDIIKKQKHFSPSLNKLGPTPKWKKYKTIERKRPSHSSEEIVREKIKDNIKEEILNAETKHVRVALQDTVTSDIPSLESLKNDLLTSNLKFQTYDSQNAVTLTPLVEVDGPTAHLDILSSTQVGHESKRAGFLNFSGKTITSEATSTSYVTTEISTETEKKPEMADFKISTNIPGMFETSSSITDIVHSEDKNKLESQIVMNEDTMKEELMKEMAIKDYEENVNQRQRVNVLNYNANHKIEESKGVNLDNSAETNSSSEVNSKSMNNEKSKNITLYTVNANYKPMKKIEVMPPKQFVRDPDDNSWRNESLSSLGIVFKPKNSSKPFTQVLKNKTETEWNNLSEKDIKNDLPDLRERLQKMGEKRKSKRKKIDSFGNTVYIDYEENSSSGERGGVTIDELTSIVTTYSPALDSTTGGNGITREPQNVTETVTTNSTTESVSKNSFATTIPKKLFREYYDSTDEDDTDYLNMAKIDLKKFTTSLRPSTPFFPSTIVAKQPDWLKQKSKLSVNAFPERKATVQYFPPLTTQKVNINDYDNGFKFKMESFTTETDVPEHVLPASVPIPTTPPTFVSTPSASTVGSKSDLTEKMLLTRPQLTTDPGVALNDEVSFDRGTYVIKHYKDFVKVAAKNSEYDKNFGYIPYTEAPAQGVTNTAHLRYNKESPRPIDNGYEDYETQFRKDVLQRFVDNFNQNSERYRSEFPILFNSSIIHTESQSGDDVASSRAFMRGLYNGKFALPRKTCEPNCDKLVELSPAYELHYYMPDQEEKEEVAPQPVTLPYQYRL